jgi:hypothetical protein
VAGLNGSISRGMGNEGGGGGGGAPGLNVIEEVVTTATKIKRGSAAAAAAAASSTAPAKTPCPIRGKTNPSSIDAVILRPAGVNPQSNAATLRIDLGDGNYAARLRVMNFDSSLTGRFLSSVRSTQTQVAFTASLDTAQGSSTESFTFRGFLDNPGDFSDFPVTASGDPVSGPGTVSVAARNLGALDTVVTLAAYPISCGTSEGQ